MDSVLPVYDDSVYIVYLYSAYVIILSTNDRKILQLPRNLFQSIINMRSYAFPKWLLRSHKICKGRRPMNTEIKNAIHTADIKAQYDDRAKRLLSNKIILAHILVKTVDEFQGMEPKRVVPYIEGCVVAEAHVQHGASLEDEHPLAGVIPAEPGLTNTVKEVNGQRLVGMNTENAEINEGLVRFDIIFYVRMKDGVSQVIINLEIQKDEPTGYHILNRAIFYVSRLVSSQKERDFVKTNYNDIKRVFSIWICMNMNENSMAYLHLTKEDLLGSYPWKGRLDLLNIVMIGIANDLPEHDKKYELHRLLSTLLSAELSADEKLGIIETEYRIPIDDKLRKDVNTMCNLSQGILEMGEVRGLAKGEARGLAKGEARGLAKGEAKKEMEYIRKMYKKGYSFEQIADVSEKSIGEVKAIIEGKKPILV